MNTTCPHCGELVDETDEFCEACGQTLDAGTVGGAAGPLSRKSARGPKRLQSAHDIAPGLRSP